MKYLNLKVIILFVIILLPAYWNSFSGSWVLDDLHNILENEKLHLAELNADSLKQTFFAKPYTDSKFYRPLVNFTFALNWFAGKDDVFGYHVMNFLIHLITAFLLFTAVRLLFQTPRMRHVIMDDRAVIVVALISALFWALHPIQIQAVTYIVQRMTSMAGMFFIGGICCYLSARQTFRKAGKLSGYLGCLLCYAAAVLCKENAIVLPAVLLLIHWIFFMKGVFCKKHIIYLSLIVAVVIVAFAAGMWYYSKQTGLGSYDVRFFTMTERMLTESRVIFLYIKQFFLPLPSMFQIEHYVQISTSLLNPPTTLPSIIGIIFLICLTLYKAQRWPLVGFAILYFLGCHVIESSFLPLELVFEHRNYVPTMFVVVPIVCGCVRLWQRYGARWPRMKSYLVLTAVVVLVLLGFSTFLRNYIWQNNTLLFESVIEKYPQVSRAYNTVGRDLLKAGKPDAALIYFQRALSNDNFNRNDEVDAARIHVASAYWMMGDFSAAIAQTKENLAENPHSEYLQLMLARIYSDSGDLAHAREQYEILLENPVNTTLNFEMGNVCLRQGDGVAALKSFKTVYDVLVKNNQLKDANAFKLQLALGRACVLTGNYDDAAKWFEAVMQITNDVERLTGALWLLGVMAEKQQIPSALLLTWMKTRPQEQIELICNDIAKQPYLPVMFVNGLYDYVQRYLNGNPAEVRERNNADR